jgi:arylsulfatase A-like enzyme
VEAAEGHPNIILFLVDDMGLMDTSVPFVVDADGKAVKYPLNDFYRTPNMEKLAAGGTRFTRFYAHSVCSPTRASIMTGQNSARHRSTTWIKPQSNNRGNFGPAEWNWTGLNKTSITLPRLLQGAGYKTIHVGKAHFGPDNHEGSEPLNLGFDINVGGFSGGHPGSYYGEKSYGKGGSAPVPHLEKYHGTATFLTEALTLEANRHIEACVNEQKPFFLHMSHYALHAPFDSDPRFAKNYAQSGANKHAQAYATLVEGMDKSLGDLIDKLIELKVADNTLIIFLGDNGSDAPLGKGDYNSSAPYRQKKGWRYEGGMLVPFIAGWGRTNDKNQWQQKLPIAAGAIQTQMGTILDLLPTICTLAEVELPNDTPLDGYDLKAQFAGNKNEERTEDFLNHFPHEHRSSYFTSYVNDGWKVIYHYPLPGRGQKTKATELSPKYELFNLKEDPFEKKDLSTSHREKLQMIMAALMQDLEDKNALYPEAGNEKLRPQIPASASQ